MPVHHVVANFSSLLIASILQPVILHTKQNPQPTLTSRVPFVTGAGGVKSIYVNERPIGLIALMIGVLFKLIVQEVNNSGRG